MGVGGDRDRYRALGGGSTGFLGPGLSRWWNRLGGESFGSRQRGRRWNEDAGLFRPAAAGQWKNKNRNHKEGRDGKGSEPGGSSEEVR
jgi:hypothetical protein